MNNLYTIGQIQPGGWEKTESWEALNIPKLDRRDWWHSIWGGLPIWINPFTKQIVLTEEGSVMVQIARMAQKRQMAE